jgi:hypothetical protein
MGLGLPAPLRLALGVVPALALAPAVQAQTQLSQYSGIGQPHCRTVQGSAARPADDHDVVVERCPTSVGLEVIKAYRGTAVQVTVARPGWGKTEPQLGTGFDVGDTIEWRGRRDGARFRPGAAILRLRSRMDDGRLGSVLAILRIERDRACPVAWLDAAALPDANARAREAADAAIATFRCGTSRPGIIGPQTALVAATAARSAGAGRRSPVAEAKGRQEAPGRLRPMSPELPSD